MTFKKEKALSQHNQQTGFTLISAIFLLVVVALLSSYIVTLRAVQQTTLVYGVQGARAMQAARAGIEWGIYKALPPEESDQTSECNSSNDEFKGSGAIKDFRIHVICKNLGTHFEDGVTIIIYRLTSKAETGTYGTLDYISREFQSTISKEPD